MEHNFRKIATLNQGTPYDYNSVMQYHKWEQLAEHQPCHVLSYMCVCVQHMLFNYLTAAVLL